MNCGHPLILHESLLYKWFVLGTVMIGTFMAVLDSMIVTVALPKLMAGFGAPLYTVEWILTGYLLVFAIMLPSSSWFAGRYGYKISFMVGLFFFTAGSLLCSLSWNIEALIGFRLIQGGGAGFLLPVGMAIITREFPPQMRGLALGFWSAAASASVALGPTIGGFLVDRFVWHMIFDVNVPIGTAAILISFMTLREFQPEAHRPFDYIGFLSLSIFLTALLLALSNGNAAWNTGGWTSSYIIICFAVSMVGVLAFIIVESIVHQPLIDLSLFKISTFTFANLVLFMFGIGLFGSNFVLPLYLQNSLGYTPLQAGLVLLPMGILLGITGPFAGLLSDKIGGKLPALAGLFLLAISFYQYKNLTLYSDHMQILHPLYMRGIAMGLIFSPLTTLAISEIGNEKIARASGLINVLRQLGGSFGVAIFGAVLSQRNEFHQVQNGIILSDRPESVAAALNQFQHFAASYGGGSALENVQNAQYILNTFAQNTSYVSAINDVFLIASLTIVVSLIPAFMIKTQRHHDRSMEAAL
jgi:DHA2 family multidrug resistance protein